MGIVSLLSCAGEEHAAGESPADDATEPGVEKFNLVPCDEAPENAEDPATVGGGVLEEDVELPSTGVGLTEKLDADAALEAALLVAPDLAKEKLGGSDPCAILAKENVGRLAADVEADELDPSELAEPNAGCAKPSTLGAPNAGLPTVALADEALGIAKENDGVALLLPKSPPEEAAGAFDAQLPKAGALLSALKEIFADAPGKPSTALSSFFGGALGLGCAGVSFCSLHHSTAGSSLYFLYSILHSLEKSALYLSFARMSRICCSVFSLSCFS
jgi:hypothetical protein